MSNLNSTTMANAIKTQYEKRLLMRAVPRLVHARGAMAAKLNKYGSLEWRRYGSLSAVTTSLTSGSTPAEQTSPSVTPITATPVWYGAWIGFTDDLELKNFDPVVLEISGVLGEQAGVSVDTIIRNVITAGATKDYSANQTARANLDSPTHDVTYFDFVKQMAALEEAGALPVDGNDFHCYMHPMTWASLMTDPTFVAMFIAAEESDANSDQNPMRGGYVGRILRCKIFVSANCRKYVDGGVGGTTDVFSLLFVGKEAYGVTGMAGIDPRVVDQQGPEGKPLTGGGQRVSPVNIILKEVGSAGADDPLNQRGSVGWKTAFDTTVLNATWLRDLEHTNVASDD